MQISYDSLTAIDSNDNDRRRPTDASDLYGAHHRQGHGDTQLFNCHLYRSIAQSSECCVLSYKIADGREPDLPQRLDRISPPINNFLNTFYLSEFLSTSTSDPEILSEWECEKITRAAECLLAFVCACGPCSWGSSSGVTASLTARQAAASWPRLCLRTEHG